MRIIIVLLYTFAMLFMISVGWWVSLPVVLGVSYAIKDSNTTATGQNIALAVEYVSYAWGPVLDVIILLLAAMNAQWRDVESEAYG